jgi:hypothetical protein
MVIPAHEQALEYREVPEQAEAYSGTSLGTSVTCRAATAAVTVGGRSTKSSVSSRPARKCLGSGMAVLLDGDPITEYEVPVIVTVEVLEKGGQYSVLAVQFARGREITYGVAGVMVSIMKLEQSAVCWA